MTLSCVEELSEAILLKEIFHNQTEKTDRALKWELFLEKILFIMKRAKMYFLQV